MEQKKLLLVAISVGLFFVIIIGTALVVLKPDGSLSSAANPGVTGPASGVKNYFPTGQTPEYPYVIESDHGEEILFAEAPVEPESQVSVNIITIDPRPAAGVPSVPAERKVTAAKPAPAVSVPAAKEAVASKNPAAPAQAAAKQPAKTRDDFWVQTGAFTALSRAEIIKQTLADKGITSIIENRNVGETLYFRVRVGPYTSQNEADYWLNLIKSINGFEESQIRKTQTTL